MNLASLGVTAASTIGTMIVGGYGDSANWGGTVPSAKVITEVGSPLGSMFAAILELFAAMYWALLG
jgi:hypothetical protein